MKHSNKSAGPSQSKGSAPSSNGQPGVSRETNCGNSGKHGMKRTSGKDGNKFTASASTS